MSPVCSPWTLDETCCDLPEDTDAELIAAKLDVASELLWVGSGRRVGLCEVVARPCLRSCGGGYGLPYPYRDEDGWHNASCGCHDTCSCTRLCEVILPGPVDSIVEVSIGTDVLDESDYRLDVVGSSKRLLLLNGLCLPACQDFTAECGEEGAVCVTYMRGIEPDALAIAAVSETTCQMVRACLGLPCMLPANVQAVTRRGVSMQFDTTTRAWLRTLPMVAAFFDAVNPYALSSESSVWSPDVPATRFIETPSGS